MLMDHSIVEKFERKMRALEEKGTTIESTKYRLRAPRTGKEIQRNNRSAQQTEAVVSTDDRLHSLSMMNTNILLSARGVSITVIGLIIICRADVMRWERLKQEMRKRKGFRPSVRCRWVSFSE